MSSSLKNTRGFKSKQSEEDKTVYFVIHGSTPATLRDLCLASNSIYMHLKILVHVLPLNVYMQLPLKSMAAASLQPRAEFNLMYCSLSQRWSQLFWKLSESWNHPRKCSSQERETPQQKVQNSCFSHFSGASAREKNQKEGAMLMQFILTKYRM